MRSRNVRGPGWVAAWLAAWVVVYAWAVPLAWGQPTETSVAPTTRPAVDPKADEIFRAASKYLGSAQSYTFSADVWEDVVLPEGQKVHRQRTVRAGVRRPDRLFAEGGNERVARSAMYDGKTFTLYNREKNFYGQVDASGPIEKVVDMVDDKFGINTPLSDLMVSNLYEGAMKGVVRGDYLGRQRVNGVRCHHLAYVKGDIDWEVWVQDEGAPVIRRFVITYKDEDQAPQFAATLTDWDFDAKLSDYAFTFVPPLGASRIDVLAAKEPPPPVGTEEETGGAANLAREVQPPADQKSPGTTAPQDKKD